MYDLVQQGHTTVLVVLLSVEMGFLW